METRANYVLIGAFTLAAVVGAFLFVMWIAGYATPGGHRTFQVVFNGSVSGLSNGANVLFNGMLATYPSVKSGRLRGLAVSSAPLSARSRCSGPTWTPSAAMNSRSVTPMKPNTVRR